jgi:dehydrogenase/reductase SDR family member 7B
MIKRREGRIVCIGSVQGKFAIPYRSSYAASKHALQAFCDSLRAEIHAHNVNVTLISPGYISTDLSKNALVGSGDAYGGKYKFSLFFFFFKKKMISIFISFKVTDAATATGERPDSMAKKILREIMRDSKDSILASLAPKAAHYIRFLCPPLYFWIMDKRADKLTIKDKNI